MIYFISFHKLNDYYLDLSKGYYYIELDEAKSFLSHLVCHLVDLDSPESCLD